MDEDKELDKELEQIYAKMAEAAKIVTIVTEPGALCFCTRRTWEDLPESGFNQLRLHGISSVFKGTDSIFILLRNLHPNEYHSADSYRLLRISIDEDGKQSCSVMALSGSEADQLMYNKLSIWG